MLPSSITIVTQRKEHQWMPAHYTCRARIELIVSIAYLNSPEPTPRSPSNPNISWNIWRDPSDPWTEVWESQSTRGSCLWYDKCDMQPLACSSSPAGCETVWSVSANEEPGIPGGGPIRDQDRFILTNERAGQMTLAGDQFLSDTPTVHISLSVHFPRMVIRPSCLHQLWNVNVNRNTIQYY